VQVRIPGLLRSYTDGAERVAIPVSGNSPSLADGLAALEARFPGLRFRVVDEQERLRPNMRVFVNGLGVRDLGHALQPDDFVAIVLALSGG